MISVTQAKKILITSALPYVNNIPHLGNIIGCVLSGDVFYRYCKSRQYDCIYICGTDEYGTATEIKALEENCTPKDICDKYYKIHRDIYEWFGIKFDIFGRTSTGKHTKITHDIFNKLYKNGYIVEEEVEQPYDEKAKIFLADRYVEGTCPHCQYAGARADQCDKCGKLLNYNELIGPKSKVSGTTPVIKKSKHLFINLPDIEKDLAVWIEKTSKEGFWSENSCNIAKGWLKEGLKKRAITRDLKWGVPVPLKGWENKVFYVWFDAPIGYISITANLTEQWASWWKNPKNIRLYQFMGKDNVPFHTVIFPSTLMGTKDNWTLLHHINTTEYLNYEGGKFSKSRHLGVFGDDAKNSGIPSDVWRYYLLINRPEQSDTDFTWEDFGGKLNNELLANLGNLVNRTLVFTKNNLDGKVSAKIGSGQYVDFTNEQKKQHEKITDLLEKVKIKSALHEIMGVSKNANKFFQDNKPWELVKRDKEKAETVIYVLLNQVKDLAILIEPYLPQTSASIFRQLNIEPRKWEELGKLEDKFELGEPKILFRKIEPEEIERLKKQFSGKLVKGEGITIEDVDLEVGQIIEARQHPNADKLFIEKVRLGDGDRQIVSGLAKDYKVEDLPGRKVVIVKNLPTAKLRGEQSQGMLIVAEGTDKKAELISPEAEIGTKLMLKGAKGGKPREKITIGDFFSINFEVRDHRVLVNGQQLYAGEKEVRTEKIRDGKIT